MEAINRRAFVTGTAAMGVAMGCLASAAPVEAKADASYEGVELDSSGYPQWDIENIADPAGDIGCECNVEVDAEGEWTGVNWTWTKKPDAPAADQVSEEIDCEIWLWAWERRAYPLPCTPLPWVPMSSL